MGVPFKEFRAGDGQFACTLDISGTNPVSTCIKAGELHGILRRGRGKGFCPAIKKGGAEEYYSDLAWARRRLQERRDRRAGKTFNHPTGGASTTKKVSDALRQDRGAHLTITSPMPAWPSPSPTGRRSARAERGSQDPAGTLRPRHRGRYTRRCPHRQLRTCVVAASSQKVRRSFFAPSPMERVVASSQTGNRTSQISSHYRRNRTPRSPARGSPLGLPTLAARRLRLKKVVAKFNLGRLDRPGPR